MFRRVDSGHEGACVPDPVSAHGARHRQRSAWPGCGPIRSGCKSGREAAHGPSPQNAPFDADILTASRRHGEPQRL